jgi:hypothetical protein
MKASVDGVRLKVERARHHLDAITELANAYRSTKYEVVREVNTNAGIVKYFLKMPPCPRHFAATIGDCLHNLRSALDYLVYQLVLANNNTPSASNMFPICDSRDMFIKALKRDRLCGVSAKAKTIIEETQPYKASANRVLWTLHQLENIDKHRTLIVANGVISDQAVVLVKPSTKKEVARMQWFNPMVFTRDGSELFHCSIGAESPFEDVEAETEGTCRIAFEESMTTEEVWPKLRQLVNLIEQSVIPRFDPFFR